MLLKRIPVLPHPRWVSDSRSPEVRKGTAGNLGLSPMGCKGPSLIHPSQTQLPTPARTDTPGAVPHRRGDRAAVGQPGPFGKGPRLGSPRPGPERGATAAFRSLRARRKGERVRRGAEPAAPLLSPSALPAQGIALRTSPPARSQWVKSPNSTCPRANCRRLCPKPCPPSYPALPAELVPSRTGGARPQGGCGLRERGRLGLPPRLGGFHTRKWRPNGELEPKFVRKARGMLGREGAGLPRV